jgi:hypothetical protein
MYTRALRALTKKRVHEARIAASHFFPEPVSPASALFDFSTLHRPNTANGQIGVVNETYAILISIGRHTYQLSFQL